MVRLDLMLCCQMQAYPYQKKLVFSQDSSELFQQKWVNYHYPMRMVLSLFIFMADGDNSGYFSPLLRMIFVVFAIVCIIAHIYSSWQVYPLLILYQFYVASVWLIQWVVSMICTPVGIMGVPLQYYFNMFKSHRVFTLVLLMYVRGSALPYRSTSSYFRSGIIF